MFGYFMAIIIGALVVGYLLMQRGRVDSRDAKIILQGRGKWIAYAVAALILILLVGQSFIVIQAGTVGVVKRLGAVRSELNPGLHMIVPFLDTTEKNKLEQEKIRKEQKIVAAEADARSIDIRQAVLSKNPTLIQWEFIQKLAPNIQWGILPQNAVPLLNMQNLVGGQK